MRERAQPISLRRTLGTKNTLFDLEKRSKKLLTKVLSRDLRLKESRVRLKKDWKTKKDKRIEKWQNSRNKKPFILRNRK